MSIASGLFQTTLPECSRVPSHWLDHAVLAGLVVLSIGIALLARARLRASRRPGAVQEGAVRALIQAAKAGDESAAYRSLGRTNAILRIFVKRRIARALRASWEGSDEGGVSEAQTIQRAAVALATGKAAPADADDLAEAFAAIEARHAGPPAPRRGPLYAMGGVVAASLAVLAVVLVRNADDSRLRALFKHKAPRYRMDLNNTLLVKEGDAAGTVNPVAKASLDRMRDTLSEEIGRTRLGERGSAALGALLGREQQASASKDTSIDEEIQLLASTAGALNKLLAEHRADFLVSTDVTVRNGRRTVQFFTFDVEERAWTCVEGRSVRVTHVRRLDEVNWNINGLSLVYNREGLVILDEIEKLLVHELLPLLASGEGEGATTPAGRAAVREDLARIAEWDDKERDEVAKLLSSRRSILARIARDPDTFTTGTRYASWHGRAPDGDLLELQRIEDKLDLRKDGYRRIERAFALSTERYAAQAVRDTEPDSPRPVPAELTALAGDSPRIAAELAVIARWIGGDLAELGANEAYPRTRLAMLGGNLDDPGNFKWYAAIVVIVALGKEVGLEVNAKSQRSVREALEKLLQEKPGALSEAARRARKRLYGGEGGAKGRCAGRDVLWGLGACR